MTDSAQKLSKYLLMGWTMLAESCQKPGCPTPLMENRRGNKKIECASCGASYIRDDSGAMILSSSGEPSQPAQKPASSHTAISRPPQRPEHLEEDEDEEEEEEQQQQQQQQEEDEEEDDEQFMEELRKKRAARDIIIKKISQHLQAGWMMLATSCQPCAAPLMRSPDGKFDLCLGCGFQKSLEAKTAASSSSSASFAPSASSASSSASASSSSSSQQSTIPPTVAQAGPNVSTDGQLIENSADASSTSFGGAGWGRSPSRFGSSGQRTTSPGRLSHRRSRSPPPQRSRSPPPQRSPSPPRRSGRYWDPVCSSGRRRLRSPSPPASFYARGRCRSPPREGVPYSSYGSYRAQLRAEKETEEALLLTRRAVATSLKECALRLDRKSYSSDQELHQLLAVIRDHSRTLEALSSLHTLI